MQEIYNVFMSEFEGCINQIFSLFLILPFVTYVHIAIGRLKLDKLLIASGIPALYVAPRGV